MQTTLFDVPPNKKAEYYVYHDESGTDLSHSRYLIQGALFIPKKYYQEYLDLLGSSRNGYLGRIHFVDLRDNPRSMKGEAAWNWMNIYFAKLSYSCPFKCMVADIKSNSEYITRFKKPYLLYNYIAMLAIRSALPWSFSEYDQLILKIFSEKMDRSSEDDFVKYLPRELVRRVSFRRAGQAKCPSIYEPIDDVRLIIGDPEVVSPEESCHCEFIQLTDLLTSAVGQAINASSTRAIKIDMGKIIARWIEDTRLLPWIQDQGLHRRFSVSCFPDASGKFYNVPLAIENKDQMELF